MNRNDSGNYDGNDRGPKNPILLRLLIRLAIVLVAFIVFYVTNMGNKTKQNNEVSSLKGIETNSIEQNAVNKSHGKFEYTGKNNLKISSDQEFELVTDKEKLDDFYAGGVHDYDVIMMALQNPDTRLVVTKMSYENYIVYVENMITNLKNLPDKEKEEDLNSMPGLGYSDIEISYFKKSVDEEPITDEERKYFYQEYILQNLMIESQDNSTFVFVGRDDIMIDAQKVQRFEYLFKDDGNIVRFFDVIVYKDPENIYNIGVWGYEDSFVQNRDSYKSMLESFTIQ